MLAGVALALQNLSNGYFLVYAALWLPPYVLAQMALRGRLRDRRAWLGPLVCASVGIGLTAPFLYPYAQLRALGQPPRPLVAVVQYSADTYAWLTANEQLRLLGIAPADARAARGRSVPRPGAAAARARGARPGWPARWRARRRRGDRRRSSARRLAAGFARRRRTGRWRRSSSGTSLAILAALFAGQQRLYLGPVTISITDGTRLLVGLVAECCAAARRLTARARRVP